MSILAWIKRRPQVVRENLARQRELDKRVREMWKYRALRFRCINCGEVGRYRWHLEHRKECLPTNRSARRREARYCPVCKGKHRGKHGG